MDLVSFGEAMLRLSPPGYQRLEQARTLDVHVGGGELNVAVAAARLGLATAWISRLPDNPIGRMIAMRAREQGVDVSGVLWTRDDRAGIYFAETGAAPRPSSVLYDRTGSAISRIACGSIDWETCFHGARWFHTSGITPALSPGAAAVTAEALTAAKRAGLTTSYDLNYRSKLWTPEQARVVQEPLLEQVDLLITTEEDTSVVLGIETGADADAYQGVALELQRRYGLRAVAITLRENPLVWRNSWSALLSAGAAVHRAPRYEVEIVDRIGAGDAFSAGLIFGMLRFGDWDRALQIGTAVSALKHTVPGDWSLASLAEVEALLAGGSLRVSR